MLLLLQMLLLMQLLLQQNPPTIDEGREGEGEEVKERVHCGSNQKGKVGDEDKGERQQVGGEGQAAQLGEGDGGGCGKVHEGAYTQGSFLQGHL